MKVVQIKLAVLLLLSLFVFSTKASNSSKVNLFIGTSGDNGQVDPGAAVPFGMVRVCPDSDPRSHAGYDYSVRVTTNRHSIMALKHNSQPPIILPFNVIIFQ